MNTKSEQIKDAIKSENFIVAFRIAKNFFTGLSKEEKRSIDIAHECNCGKTDFYKSLGVDIETEINKATNILKIKFA